MLDLKGLQLRAAFFQAIRSFFQERGFLEVDTPIRQPLVLPEQNIVPIPSAAQFLQSSPEIHMKRLLATGCEEIFQICRCFRYGERGRLHLEEFVMLEWYRLDADYTDLMIDCEQLFASVLSELAECSLPVNLHVPWEKITVEQSFNKYCSISLQKALEEDRFDLLLVEEIEPNLGIHQPTILYDYPLELASLARVKEGHPEVAERFELYVAGIELANGFSELTDPAQQRLRFEDEYSKMAHDFGRPRKMPELFLADLQRIDRAAGIAMGLDRLFMLLLGQESLEDVLPFAPSDMDS